MSEAIIARGGRKGGGSGSDFHGLMTEVYTSSTMWLVPSNAVNNEFSVRIFGGGGGGSPGGGGGGGWMNNDTLTLEPGTLIFINIGSGGESVEDSSYDGSQRQFWATSGGITSFGTYLSASGGSAPTVPNNDYKNQSWLNATGGSGGSGGGGWLHGGRGYQFGGGGGSIGKISDVQGSGGHGGPWGGGGGGNTIGQGGTYGGNGGNITVAAENGTNTIGWTNVGQELNGSYITGFGWNCPTIYSRGACGGGGFGGCGGSGASSTTYHGGGGGGGYGADGGNGYHCSGGGGGYGKGGYGGDYGISLLFYAAGGGGSYGRGGSLGKEGPLFGGGGSAGQDGADGICIIQYYVS